MKKALKLISALLIFVLLTGVLAGCGEKEVKTGEAKNDNQKNDNVQTTGDDKGKEAAKEQEKVSLRFYTSSGTDKTEFDYIIPEWNKLNPNINVECIVLTGGDSWTKIRTAIAGGEHVDIVMMERDFFRDKADKLYFKLNDLMKKDNFDYLKEFREYARGTMVGDDIYGISKVIAPSAIWLNKECIDNAGILMPDEDNWTFDEYFELMKKLTIRDSDGKVKVYGGMFWQRGYTGILDLATYGGWDIVTADGKPNVYDPVLREAIQKYYNAMFVDKSMPTDAEVKANKLVAIFDFCKGKFATFMGASNSALFMDIYKLNGHLSQETDDKDVIKILKMPRWDKNSPENQATAIVVPYSVTKVTKHPEEAYKFLKWYSTEGLVLSSKVAHRVPGWKNADKDILIGNWRFYMDKDNNVVEGKDRRELYLKALDPDRVYITNKNRLKYAYSSMMLEELKKEVSIVLAGEKDIDEALRDAQKACQEIYNREK